MTESVWVPGQKKRTAGDANEGRTQVSNIGAGSFTVKSYGADAKCR